MGLIVSAHLRSLLTAADPGGRLAGKMGLMQKLYARGLDAKGVREMYKVIDWFLELPRAETVTFEANLEAMEQELDMPYVTSLEKLWLERGRSSELSLALIIKFGEAGRRFAEEHLKEADAAFLDRVHDSLLDVATVEELRHAAGLI